MLSKTADFAPVSPPGELDETHVSSLVPSHSLHCVKIWRHPHKPEVHNVLHCCQRKTEPRPSVTCTENWNLEFWTRLFEVCDWTDKTDKQPNKQTYRHADRSTFHLYWDEVISCRHDAIYLGFRRGLLCRVSCCHCQLYLCAILRPLCHRQAVITLDRCAVTADWPSLIGTTTRRVRLLLSPRVVELCYPCGAVLARYLLWPCVRLSVRPSVTSRCCIESVERIELVSGTEASVGPRFILLNTPNSGLGKISQLLLDRCKCCQHRWTLSVINWRQLSVTSLSHWASTFVYNTMGVTQLVARVCLRQPRLVTM